MLCVYIPAKLKLRLFSCEGVWGGQGDPQTMAGAVTPGPESRGELRRGTATRGDPSRPPGDCGGRAPPCSRSAPAAAFQAPTLPHVPLSCHLLPCTLPCRPVKSAHRSAFQVSSHFITVSSSSSCTSPFTGALPPTFLSPLLFHTSEGLRASAEELTSGWESACSFPGDACPE